MNFQLHREAVSQLVLIFLGLNGPTLTKEVWSHVERNGYSIDHARDAIAYLWDTGKLNVSTDHPIKLYIPR